MKPHLKSIKSAIAILIALAAALATSTAWAYGSQGHGYRHHGGARVGIFIGSPALGYPYYGYPNYGYGHAPYGYAPYGYASYGYAPYGYPLQGYYGATTTVIATPATQPVYIEQSSATNNASGNSSGPASDGYWYYCSNPDGYYPYVKQCANGWQRVPPQPIDR